MDRSETFLEKSNILADLETSLSENEIDKDLGSRRLKEDLSYHRPIYNEITEIEGFGSFSSQENSLYNNSIEPSDDQISNLKRRLAIISLKKEIHNDMKLVRVEAAMEFKDRPKNGVIYKEFTSNITERITERLEYLSKKDERFTIDEAIEIEDASYLLKLFGRPEEEIGDVTLAGQMAGEGTNLILLAEKLAHNGRILLDQSKSMMSANFKQINTS